MSGAQPKISYDRSTTHANSRQAAFFDPVGHGDAVIATLKSDYARGHVFHEHFHERDQLIYACDGVMTVTTSQGIWVVPAQRAVWIPARIPHAVRVSTSVSLRTLYLRSRLARALPRSCCVVNVSSLLRELILNACNFTTLDRKIPRQAHLISVILDQLELLRTVPLQLPSPKDPRARRVAQVLASESNDDMPLNEICRLAGASRRTIDRCFYKDISMSLGKWRQQLRLMRALQLLAEGEKIAHVAASAGYSTASSFVSCFKRTLGTTPGRYFDTLAAADSHSPNTRNARV